MFAFLFCALSALKEDYHNAFSRYRGRVEAIGISKEAKLRDVEAKRKSRQAKRKAAGSK
jgi:hypothetical protein